MNEQKKVVVFLDSVNRTIIAEPMRKTADMITMKNPAIISISFDQKGKMILQLIPVFFRELFTDKNYEVTFDYVLNNITCSNIETKFSVDEKGELIIEDGIEGGIIQQYAKLFSVIPTEELIKG